MKKKDEFAEKNDQARALAFDDKDGKIAKQNHSAACAIMPAEIAKQNHSAACAIMPAELEGVPEEVLSNLTGLDDMVADERILYVLSSGQLMSVDKIILGLYHKYKHIESRAKIIARLNRLVRLDEVKKDPHRRSMYCLAFYEAKTPGQDATIAQGSK